MPERARPSPRRLRTWTAAHRTGSAIRSDRPPRLRLRSSRASPALPQRPRSCWTRACPDHPRSRLRAAVGGDAARSRLPCPRSSSPQASCGLRRHPRWSSTRACFCRRRSLPQAAARCDAARSRPLHPRSCSRQAASDPRWPPRPCSRKAFPDPHPSVLPPIVLLSRPSSLRSSSLPHATVRGFGGSARGSDARDRRGFRGSRAPAGRSPRLHPARPGGVHSPPGCSR
jgi:hypothetical protein